MECASADENVGMRLVRLKLLSDHIPPGKHNQGWVSGNMIQTLPGLDTRVEEQSTVQLSMIYSLIICHVPVHLVSSSEFMYRKGPTSLNDRQVIPELSMVAW